MNHNFANVKITENGLRYIDVDRNFIPVIVKNKMLTIQICKPKKKELRTCTHIDISSDTPWNPEDIQQKDIITPEL